jgi:hypothetical protein
MNADSIERLELKQGEQVTERHVRALSAAVNRDNATGINVRSRVLPWGTIRHYDGGGNGFTPPTFAPTVARTREGFSVSFERGLIAGVEPSINGIALSATDPETRRRPALLVPFSMFEGYDEVGIYFRVSLSREWTAEKAEPFASAEFPKQEPWKADKLACLVRSNGTAWRALYFNIGLESIRRGFISDGRASHLFFAV